VDVTLQPITEDNVGAVFDLKVKEGQGEFVASNPWSLAQALAEYAVAWPRAIVAGGGVVGFLMLEIDPDDDDGRPFWLWRLMIDGAHQGKGYGAAALKIAIDEVRTRGGSELFTSWVPGEGSPEGFYHKIGFEPTGEIDEGEIVARLDLNSH
jgi:diamine N-acetyltransferase